MMNMNSQGQSPSTSKQTGVVIGLYVAVASLFWMAQYLYMPTLPVYIKTKTPNLALVGVVLSMYGLWQTFVRIPLGMLADWCGWRKPFMLVGIALAGVGAAILGLATNAPMLILGRAITGVAAGTWVLLVVGFNSLFAPGQTVRATALLSLSSSVGRMLATALTGPLNTVGGYALAFFLAAGLAGLSVLTLLPVPEHRRTPQPPSFQKFAALLQRRSVLVPSLTSAVLQHAIWASSYGFIPIMTRQLGLSDIVQSLLISMNIGMIVIGNTLTATLTKSIGVRRLMYLCTILIFVGISSTALMSSVFSVFAAQLCTGLAWGIGYPILMGMSIEHVADSERATAMGIHQALYGVGMFSGPWLGGLLADSLGIQPMLGVTAVICFVLGLAGTRWLSQK